MIIVLTGMECVGKNTIDRALSRLGYDNVEIMSPQNIRENKSNDEFFVVEITAPEFVRWRRMKKKYDTSRIRHQLMVDRVEYADINDIVDYSIDNDGSRGAIQIAKKIVAKQEDTKEFYEKIN